MSVLLELLRLQDRTNDIKRKPIERFLDVDALRFFASKAPNLLDEKVDIMVNEGFLVAQGLRAESVCKVLSLPGVLSGLCDRHNTRMIA